MGLDRMAKDAAEETMQLLEQTVRAGRVIAKPVAVTPRRMRALILFSQQRMNVNINGQIIQLVEDDSAPQDLAEAIAEACHVPIPEGMEDVVDEPTPEELAEFRKWRSQGGAR